MSDQHSFHRFSQPRSEHSENDNPSEHEKTTPTNDENKTRSADFPRDRQDGRFHREDRGDRFPRDRQEGRFHREDRGDRFPRDRQEGRFHREDRGDRFPRDRQEGRFHREDRGDRFSHDRQEGRFNREDRGDRFPRDRQEGRFNREDRGDRFPRDRQEGRFNREDRGDRFPRDRQEGRFNREDRGGRPPRDGQGGRFNREDRGDRFPRDRQEGRFNREDRGGRPPRDGQGGRFARDGAPRKPGVMDLLKEADQDLLRLIIKRTRLREKLSETRYSGKERDLRLAWEESAARSSRDPRLTRDIFALLQEIDVLPAQAESPAFFNLCPPMQPIKGDVSIPASNRKTCLLLALASAAGVETRIQNVMLSSQTLECMKMLKQAGAVVRWEEEQEARFDVYAGTGIAGKQNNAVLDRVIHVGDDPLNLYLLLFLMATRITRLKVVGESALRFLDLASLRHFLPSLGCRLTNVIPGQEGLPARLESSGLLPDTIVVPSDLPADALTAFLLATPFWDKPVRIDLNNHPAATSVCAEVLALLKTYKCTVQEEGDILHMTPSQPVFPTEVTVEMDNLAAFALLAFVGFGGGELSLRGRWYHAHPLSEPLLGLLDVLVECTATDTTLTAKARDVVLAPNGLAAVPDDLLGVAFVVALRAAQRTQTQLVVSDLSDKQRELLEDFIRQIHYAFEDDRIVPVVRGEDELSPPWAAPSLWWAVAYALAAFMQPNIRLINPSVLTGHFPMFWSLFNSLPNPVAERKSEPIAEEEQETVPQRRRVKAGFLPDDQLPPALDMDEDD